MPRPAATTNMASRMGRQPSLPFSSSENRAAAICRREGRTAIARKSPSAPLEERSSDMFGSRSQSLQVACRLAKAKDSFEPRAECAYAEREDDNEREPRMTICPNRPGQLDERRWASDVR